MLALSVNRHLLRLGAYALERGQTRFALAATSLALLHKPTMDGMGQLAVVYRTQGRLERALACLHLALTKFPSDDPSGILHLLGMTEAATGDFQKAITHLEEAVKRRPSNVSVAYQLASCLAMERRFEQADEIFSRGLPILCGDGKFTSTRNIRFSRSSEAEQMLGKANPLASRQVKWPADLSTPLDQNANDPEVLYFVCCDSRYLKLFVEPLINSIAQNGQLRCALHIHVVNPDSDSELLLQRTTERAAMPIKYSIESIDLSALSEDQRRTYFACARFLIVPELLSKHRIPIIVADIDQLVVGDLRPLVASAQLHDVSLLYFDSAGFNLLSLISASILVINATECGHSFAGEVCDYLVERMEDAQALSWHLDQAALAVTYLRFREARYNLLSPQIMISDGRIRLSKSRLRHALFWSVTYSIAANSSKMFSRDFRRYMNPLSRARSVRAKRDRTAW